MNSKLVIGGWLVAVLANAACSAAPDGGPGPNDTQSSAVTSPPGRMTFGAILPRLDPANPTASDPTVPDNGDVNPYGVAFVPAGFPGGGILHPGDVIISNFNNSSNLQGTGTTIVRVNKNASPSLFFTAANNPGLSTALGALSRGFVLVGNLPSTDGSGVCTEVEGQEEGVGQGALLVINHEGRLVQTLTDAKLLNGPWDLTVKDEGFIAAVFVSNALSGSVTRLDLAVGDREVVVLRKTQIASGYVHRCDPAAFVVGPTGVALDSQRDVLYVASAGDNAIYAVANASTSSTDHGKGVAVVTDATHLHGPLGLARAANGDLISAQGDAVNPDPNQPSEIVEFSPQGRFITQFSIDPAPGSAFGLALQQFGGGFRFAAVDDGLNVLDIWVVR